MIYKFCPQCASPLTMKNKTEYECSNAHIFYNNPRATMSVLFKGQDGKYLFGVRNQEPCKGKIDTVGGFFEYNEPAFEATKREIYEETGLRVNEDDLRLVGTVTSEYQPEISTLALIYVCERWEGEPIPADDVGELVWEDIDVMTSDRYAWKSHDFDRIVNIIKANDERKN